MRGRSQDVHVLHLSGTGQGLGEVGLFIRRHSQSSMYLPDSHACGSQLRLTLPLRGHLAMSGDIFGYHTGCV